MNVTILSIIDPGRGVDEFSTPDAGNRFVGVKFKVQNTGSSSIDEDANNDASVQGSDGQSYSPDFNNIRGCTNFNNGSFKLSVGGSVVGCVIFQLPKRVKVSKVQFATSSGFGGDTAEWLNP